MNQRNFEYLSSQLKYTGFGQTLNGQLKDQIEKDQQQFRLQHTSVYGKDQLHSTLQFTRSMQSDLYFFNSYKASIQKDQQPQGPSQTFYIGREGANITQKEAYNLLDGRSVFKDMTTRDGKLYQAWLQLDFNQNTPNGNYRIKQYNSNYGYDLIGALNNLPIKELAAQQERLKVIESLLKGNRQSVTLLGQQGEQKVYLEANPQFKAVILYDVNYQRITPASKLKEEQQNTISERESQSQRTSRGLR